MEGLEVSLPPELCKRFIYNCVVRKKLSFDRAITQTAAAVKIFFFFSCSKLSNSVRMNI